MNFWEFHYLEVDGVRRTCFERFVIRWAVSDAGPIPVLYEAGKRVTKPWRLHLLADSPADPHGGNANTD